MKKYLFTFAIIACAIVITTSCSSSEPVPPEEKQYTGELEKTKYSDQAAKFVIPADLEEAEDALGSGATLTSLSFTESGKAIVEISTDEGVKFGTYNVTISGDTYTITDDDGKQVGIVQKLQTHSSSVVYITLELDIVIAGVYHYHFVIIVPVPVDMITGTVDTKTNNLARTWNVEQMNIVLEGDVDLSKLEQSGNLKVFADAAQEANAELTDDEYRALSKEIASMTFDKNGLFSIEYTDGITEACDWEWTSSEQKAIRLKLRKRTDFGNKFLSNDSYIEVDFTDKGVALTLSTDIKGSKSYKATLSMVLK